MAHTLSAQKRVRQSIKKHLRNKRIKTRVKTQLRKTRQLLGSLPAEQQRSPDQFGAVQPARAAADGSGTTPPPIENIRSELLKTYRILDKAAASGVIHKNKSARLKSRLTLALNRKEKN